MKSIQLEKKELLEIKKLINSILGKSARGLFYSIGQIIGRNIARKATNKNREKYFNKASELILEKNIAEFVSFEGDIITTKNCVEILDEKKTASDANKCHIMRGLIVALYEAHQNKKRYCEEVECQSLGAERCVFKIDEEML
ncbi:MAG: V4R domain-containing protein [Candidatus Altiarchaeota archaeon]|nr:V4R domain-containing protein [Candidatus Altiarchaeota archaeon]